MEPFSHSVDIPCPECKPYGKRNRRHMLECSERNYSGCGIDIGTCPECGKTWEVSYVVGELVRAPDWDIPTRAVREALESKEMSEKQADAEQIEREQYEYLKRKFG